MDGSVGTVRWTSRGALKDGHGGVEETRTAPKAFLLLDLMFSRRYRCAQCIHASPERTTRVFRTRTAWIAWKRQPRWIQAATPIP